MKSDHDIFREEYINKIKREFPTINEFHFRHSLFHKVTNSDALVVKDNTLTIKKIMYSIS